MIKVNLLPQKRAKRTRGPAVETPGTREFAIGCAALVGFAAIMFLAVDRPKRARLAEVRESNQQLQNDINAKNKQLVGFPELKKAKEEADVRAQSINRLLQAKVVPAFVLQELGKILTINDVPTMTEEMTKKTGNGAESDPNKRFDLAWDPTHVWLLSYVDKGDGKFTLEGGAQTEADVTQFAKRLAASVYFTDVAPSSEERVSDRDNAIEYYKFQITGKVAY